MACTGHTNTCTSNPKYAGPVNYTWAMFNTSAPSIDSKFLVTQINGAVKMLDAERARRILAASGIPFRTRSDKITPTHLLTIKTSIRAIQTSAWTYLTSTNVAAGLNPKANQVEEIRTKLNVLGATCFCQCNYYCTCNCYNTAQCECNYAVCSCDCNYAGDPCSCYCNYVPGCTTNT